MIGGAINQDVQENKTSDDHVSEDMDCEVVSVSSTEGETPVKRSHSYDEAVNLENSSDFCIGQLANIARDLDSSTSIQDSKLQQQGEFQEKGFMDSMEIVDLPSGGSMEHVQLDRLGEEGESGNTTNEKTDNLEKLPENRMDTDNTGTGSVESTPKMDISQGGEISISHETGSALIETSNTDTLSSENVEKPQATPSQNKGAEDEVRDSGTLSTENTVYKSTWSQNGGQEQQVIDALKTLDVRKRKSPDRDIPEVGKKPHLSENQSDGDDNGNKEDPNEEGIEEIEDDDQTTDDEDEDDNDKDGDEGGNNDGENENTNHNRSKKSKKGTGKKKKGKLKYQKKKGQLADKPTDNKEEETKEGSLKKAQKKKTEAQNTTSDVSKIPHKQEKNEDNEKFKSQANAGCIDLNKSTEKKQQTSSNDGRANKETMTAQLKSVENNPGSAQNLNKNDPQRGNIEKEVSTCTKTCYLG